MIVAYINEFFITSAMFFRMVLLSGDWTACGPVPVSRTQRIVKRVCGWSASNLRWDVADNDVGGFL